MSLQVACGHPPGPTPPADYAPSLRSPWRVALEEHQFSRSAQDGGQTPRFPGKQELRGNTEERQLFFEKIERAAVGIANTNNTLASVGQEKRGRRRHTGPERQCRLRPFQQRKLGLETLNSRVESITGVKRA
nr:hypothetical protein [Acidiferrobacter sp. SPIII_3]